MVICFNVWKNNIYSLDGASAVLYIYIYAIDYLRVIMLHIFQLKHVK